MTALSADLWTTKAARLEEEKATLRRVWEVLADAEMRLHRHYDWLAPTLAQVERAMSEANQAQEDHIDRAHGFEPFRDGESGRKGGLAGDLAFLQAMETPEVRELQGARIPVLSRALLADVRSAAKDACVAPRFWLEAVVRWQLQHRRPFRPETFQERLRERLRQEPATCHELARDLDAPTHNVTVALKNLRRRGLLKRLGPYGSRNCVWVSLEEL